MASSKDIDKLKNDFLAKQEASLKKNVVTAEKRLFTLILENFITRLDTENGVIKDTKANQDKIIRISRIIESWNKTENNSLVAVLANDLKKLSSFNKQYFNSLGLENDSSINKIVEQSEDRMLRSIGLEKKGKLTPSGYLDNFLKDSTTRNSVVRVASSAIVNRQRVSDLTSNIKDLLVTSPTSQGTTNRLYRTYAYETYLQYDRAFSSIIADKLGLQAFIFEGSVIAATRDFCKQRAGKVFTREEAEKWKLLNFKGKNKGYDPLQHLGGHECRHNVRWISVGEALRRRKDLILVSGRLRLKN